MASITVRNVPDEVHRALRVRAAQHGRSAERGFPTPDGYIAAIAASRGFIVASRETSLYEAGGLRVVDPWQTRSGAITGTPS